MASAPLTSAAPDPRVVPPLDRLRGAVRRYVALDGVLTAGLVLAGWAGAALVLDYGLFKATGFDWVQDAPWGLRAAALGGLVGALVLAVAVGVGRRLARELSYPALALVLEKRYPQLLGDRLITAVELADPRAAARAGYSVPMIERTVAEARDRVGRIPVGRVFDWARLRRKGAVLVAAGVGVLAGAYGLAGLLGGDWGPGRFARRAFDVAAISGERNVLLRDVPWPRRAHLELVGFPGPELRVGKDAPPPTVRARAYEWVVADAGTRDGWRPLRWADLTPALLGPEQGGVAVPRQVDVRQEAGPAAAYLAWAALLGGPGLPTDRPVAVRTVDLDPLTADEVFASYPDRTGEVRRLLEEAAARPAMSRTLRKLDLPAVVTLLYAGNPAGGGDRGGTRGAVRLTREPGGDYSAEVAGLKESVGFAVRAEDFRTPTRSIVLVPPPMLTRLWRTESQPAYLHHPPPADATAGDDRPAPRWEALKGLRQVVADKDLSLTGDKSVCSVPAGTDVTLRGTVDKPLRAAQLVRRGGDAYGGRPPDPVPVGPEGDRFAVRFPGVREPVEFDLVLEDHDGVRSTRPVLVQVVEDRAPQVEVQVDVLRRVGPAYLCTPVARVPLVKESIVRDDAGLSKVEFQFVVSRVEAQVVVGLQAQAAAGVWAFAPAAPHLGSALGPVAAAAAAGRLGTPAGRVTAALPAGPFDRALDAVPRDTPAVLAAKLGRPPAAPGVVKDVRFPLDGDAFDLADADRVLEARGRRMRVPDPGEVQPRYRVDLEVVAADTNVETGPKVGRNLEPVRLLVVSEADLLAEISKDEEVQIAKLDDALRKVRGAQDKFAQQADRLLTQAPAADLLLSARVRAEDIAQDVGKARDLCQVVAAEYGRLRREVDANRCNEAVGRRYEAAVIRPLEAVLAAEFRAAEDALAAYRDLLGAGRPDDSAAAATRTTLAALVLRLAQIRDQLGEALSLNKLRDDLRKLIEDRLRVSAALDRVRKAAEVALFSPTIKPAGPVTLARGGKATVRHAIDWNVYDKGELAVRIEVPPGGGVTGPGELTVKDDVLEFGYELTAGATPGEFPVRVVPAVGQPVEVRVTVR